MSKEQAPKKRKATNLYLSNQAVTQAEKLKAALHRPSISNVVESLIREEAVRQKIAA